jgi:hypothetical protein
MKATYGTLPFKLREETLKLERSLGEINLALSGKAGK